MGSALNRATQGASPPSKTLRETPVHAQQGDDAKPAMEVVEGPAKVQQESKLPLIEETLQPVNKPLQLVNHPLQPVSHPVQEWLMKKHSGRVPIRQSLRQSLSTFDNSVYSENPVKAWGTLRSKLEPSVESAKQEADIKSQMQDCILGTGGELSALLRAATLGATYLQLDPQGRLNFQLVMVENFGPNGAQTEAAMETFRYTSSEGGTLQSKLEAMALLRRSLCPGWIKMLKCFNSGVELDAFSKSTGMRFLLDFRTDLMHNAKTHPLLKPLDLDIKELFQTWFDFGFLSMEQLTWSSSATTLNQVIQYEAVHKIASWDDLRHRLEKDRRVYSFFHPRLPGTPLIFVEVALQLQIAGSIQRILDTTHPERHAIAPVEATVAVFYSISNTQVGLQGVSFGNLLIKRVAASLQKDLPNIKTFVTLSPLPGFRVWCRDKFGEPNSLKFLVKPEELAALKDALSLSEINGAAIAAAIDNQPLKDDPNLAAALEPLMLRLGAHYLVNVKGRGTSPIDPVARFHLANGAYIHKLHWMADTSPKGQQQSITLMLNYYYDLSQIEENHENYAHNGYINATDEVKAFAREAQAMLAS